MSNAFLVSPALALFGLVMVATFVGCSSNAVPTPAAANSPITQDPTAPKAAEVLRAIAPPIVPRSIRVTIPAGTAVLVRTDTALTTKTAQAGEAFSGSLSQPLLFEGHEVAARGARVRGVVVSSSDGGRVKGRSSIAVRLTSLTLANGHEMDLQTSSVTQVARGTKKKDGLKIGIASGIGAAIGAIAGGGKGAAIGAGAGAAGGTGVVLATKGEPAVIPAETVLRFLLREPVDAEAAR